MSKKIGDRIRKYRQLAGLNQEYVAEEIGMSGGNFGKIERGEIDINTEYLFKLSKLFNVPVTDFFEEKPVMTVQEKPGSYGFASKADLEQLSEALKKLTVQVEKLSERLPKKRDSKKSSPKKK